MKWRLGTFLQENKITPYRLWVESGLARQTVYTLAQNRGDRVDLNTLGTVITTLERILGKPVHLDDLLEVIHNA